MAEAKTKPTGASVDAFIDTFADDQVRDDCRAISAIMAAVTKAEATMWGTGIVGFGRYRLKYADGREADWPLAAFAPRKTSLTVYIESSFDEREALLAKLGKHTSSKACLYIKRLSDVHVPTLKKVIAASVKHTRATHG